MSFGRHLDKKYTKGMGLSVVLCATLATAQEVVQLSEVTVTSAAGFEQAIKEAPASISVITKEELEAKPFTSLHDIVSDIPGVNILGGGSQSGISIRGMEKGYTLILIDGKRVRSETGNPRELNNEDLDSNFIPPLAAIERIEVVRGPMSSLYGSDAMGGIINIITKKTPQIWSGTVEAGYSTPSNSLMGNQKQGEFYLSGPLIDNLLGLQLWGYKKLQEEDGFYGGFQESQKNSLSGKLTLTPNEHNDLFLEYSRSSQNYSGTIGKTRLSGNDSVIEREWSRDAWGAGYNGRFSLGNLELKYYQEKYKRITANANAPTPTTAKNQVTDGKFTFPLYQSIFTLGHQWTKDTLTNSDLGESHSTSYGTRSVVEKSYFMENEWELLPQHLYLTLGTRLTDNQFFGNHWSPRGYLVYHLNSQWTLKGGVGTGYKSPKISQIDPTTGSRRGSGNNTYRVLGNPDLKPEESISYEIGAYYTQSAFSGSISLFKNDFKNKIINTSSYRFLDNGGNPIAAFACAGTVGSRNCPAWATWLNLKGADIYGLELDGEWDINALFRLKGNYTYSHSKIDAGDVTINTPAGPRSFGQTLALLDGNSLAGVPKHSGAATLFYTASKSLSFFIRGKYESQLTVVSFENNSVNKSEKDLLTFDTGVSYALTKNLKANLTVFNLADEVRFKRNNDTGSYRYSERGRSFWASIKATF